MRTRRRFVRPATLVWMTFLLLVNVGFLLGFRSEASSSGQPCRRVLGDGSVRVCAALPHTGPAIGAGVVVIVWVTVDVGLALLWFAVRGNDVSARYYPV